MDRNDRERAGIEVNAKKLKLKRGGKEGTRDACDCLTRDVSLAVSPSYIMASPMSIESATMMPATTSPSNEGYQSTFANSLSSQHEMM